MLIPRRVKHRKQHHPSRSGAAKGGTQIAFGDYGIQALEPAYVTNRQIESARIAMTRHIKRGGKVWINIYPDRPITKKPAETRMGSGKGSPEWWVANIKPGRMMFELSGVPEQIAREAMLRANIDFGFYEARTTFGRIGVKVWIYKGDVTARELAQQQAAAPRPPRGPRGDRGDRPARGARRPATGARTVETGAPASEPSAPKSALGTEG